MRVHERTRDVQGNLGGEKVGMTIDTSALAHIMSVLTDLYSDPELAIIREYSTNALDSHIEAGQTRPIEVTTPSPLSPHFTVRDYGTGLDAEGIREVYSRYGTSTKRESDDVVGMLGLGCKSALTYCDNFTLTGVKDGRMVQVLIGRDEDGAGSMTIVADEATDEPNGVIVTIPAKRENQLAEKAAQFFAYWDLGTVLLDGEIPAHIADTEGAIRVSDTTILVPYRRHYYREPLEGHTVVMGNVPYPWLGERSEAPLPCASGYRVVAWVPIGTVLFTPSREALQATPRTRAALAQLKTDVEAQVVEACQRQIKAAPTLLEAAKLAHTMYHGGLIPNTEPGTLGRDVPLTFNREVTRAADLPGAGYMLALGVGLHRKTGDWRSSIRNAYPMLFLEGFTGKALTPVRREKLLKYLDQHFDKDGKPDRPYSVICVPKLTAAERKAIDGHHRGDWADVEAIALPTAPGTKTSRAGTYKVAKLGGYASNVPAAELDKLPNLHYTVGNEYGLSHQLAVKLGLAGDWHVVCLPSNRRDKFRRDFPNVPDYREACQKLVDAQIKAIPEGAWFRAFASLYDNRIGSLIEALLKAPQPIADPDLTAFFTEWQGVDPAHVDAAIRLIRASGGGLLDRGHAACQRLYALMDNRYPLLSGASGRINAAHAALYINAAYAAERGLA